MTTEEYIKIVAAIQDGTIRLSDLSMERRNKIQEHIRSNKEARTQMTKAQTSRLARAMDRIRSRREARAKSNN
jgi:hypothetical protein